MVLVANGIRLGVWEPKLNILAALQKSINNWTFSSHIGKREHQHRSPKMLCLHAYIKMKCTLYNVHIINQMMIMVFLSVGWTRVFSPRLHCVCGR